MRCRRCGKDITNESQYCEYCGISQERKPVVTKDGTEKKKSSWGFVAWWNIDSDKMQEQLDNYANLKITESYRKISALLILLSVVITALISTFTDAMPTDVLYGAGLYVILAFFVYRGHRWALVFAMILWTFEKGYMVIETFNTGKNTSRIVMQVVWWCFFMGYFYKAFMVERRRVREMKEVAQANVG